MVVTIIVIFLYVALSPCSRGDRHRQTSGELERDARRGYDSDFNKFMSKMFSALPQGRSTIRKQVTGPNIGYLPYWYGYNYEKGTQLPDQKLPSGTTEDWDYGLDGAKGRNIWGGGKMKVHIGGDHGMLGAAAALENDRVQGTEAPRDPDAPFNWGPSGRLGPPGNEYDPATITRLYDNTKNCDQPCSKEDLNIGVVCAMDKYYNYFEIDRCVMKKNNCLKGTAYIKGNWNYQNFSNLIAVHDDFVHVSIRGTRDAHIWVGEAPRMKKIYGGVGGFEVSVDSFGADRHSAVYFGYQRATSYPAPGKYWRAMNENNWTEYTLIWNTTTGWFLMSQPRIPDWRVGMYLEYTHPHPLDIRYVACSGKHGYKVEFLLHDDDNEGICETKNTWHDRTKETGSCYMFPRLPAPFYQARNYCAWRGGHLLILEDENERRVIKDIISLMKYGSHWYWVGIHCDWTRVWYTVENELVMDFNYWPWLPGEPDNFSGHENCIFVDDSIRYVDHECRHMLYFICEIEVTSELVKYT